MTEQPMLVRTAAGPIGTILGLPDRPPRAAVVFLPGKEEPRGGANQTWAHVTRALNRGGIATVRADYAGTAESWDADARDRVGGSGDVVRALVEHTGDVPLIGLSACYGLTPLTALAHEEGFFDAAAVVTPPVYSAAYAARWEAENARQPRPAIGRRLRQAPRRIAFRLRYGQAQPRWAQQTNREWRDSRTHLRDLVAHCPTWILTGSDDGCAAPLKELLPELRRHGNVELDIVEGVALYRTSTPLAQQSVRERVCSWVTRCVETSEATAART